MKDTIRQIRKDCRQAMNGVISGSMREYGLDYKLNFGLRIMQIKGLSEKYGTSVPLAQSLWKETTRELKILATLIYPKDKLTEADATLWASEIPNQEIREQVCMNLFQELPFARKIAFQWVEEVNEDMRTTGFWLLARLLLAKKLQSEIEIKELPDSIWSDIFSSNLFLRNAAILVLKHTARQSRMCASQISNKLKVYKDSNVALQAEAYNSIQFEIDFIWD